MDLVLRLCGANCLGKTLYGGHDFDRWEQETRSHVPAWMAFDFRTMYQAYFDSRLRFNRQPGVALD